MKKCRNNCIFCFIDQLPHNLRSSLYVKDDDYLESFQYGNFITLTNLSQKNIDKIIRYNLSPLYVSFHSANENIRSILFGNKTNMRASDILNIFDLNKIKVHIQIVLCPGINDGDDLLNTLDFLNCHFKNIESIGIVPVGITDYNKNPLLLRFEKENSRKLIETVNSYTELKNHKKNVFLSDEFYIISGYDFPHYKSYGNFSQIENGIGLCRNFIFEIDRYLENFSKKIIYDSGLTNKTGNVLLKNDSKRIIKKCPKKILVFTSEYFYETMGLQVEKINNLDREKTLNLNLKLKVNYLKNYFLGGNVKVAGLLTYHDFICWYNKQSSLEKKEFAKYDKILIPNIIFNKDGLTLDNKVQNDFLNIYKNIQFIDPCGKSFLKEIF